MIFGDPLKVVGPLLTEADRRGLTMRALGGVAIALRCPSARNAPLKREYRDLDVITVERDAPAVTDMMADLGFASDRRFNGLHGRTRMLFDTHDCHIDVLVGKFSMCHELDLRDRLAIHRETLTPADLLLTKLQVAHLTQKDVVDILAVLVDHDLTSTDDGVNIDYIADLVGGDWGWWRTSTLTIDQVTKHLPRVPLEPGRRAVAESRLEILGDALERAPKSRRWRMRARVGTRVAWYTDPEELA
jgi:hypothetical protein